jgi:uncharacterized protein YegP (UPF0339 family)
VTLEVYESVKDIGIWRWRLKAKNGRIVAASSEAFGSKANARRNARMTLIGLQEALGQP